jgi:putative oxidoreductase
MMDFDLAMLVLRVAVGALFIGHGLQKLAGWFDGPGLAGTTRMMESLGLRPARRNAIASGLTESVGGALLLAGLLTPLAVALLAATMITAIRKVHFANGLWASNSGYEYNLVLIVAGLAIVAAGPGSISVDSAVGLDLSGLGWALAALAAAIVGSTATIEIGKHSRARSAPGTPASA